MMRELVFAIFAAAILGTLLWCSWKSKQKRFPTMFVVSLLILSAFYLFQYGNLSSFDVKALSAQARFVREKSDEVVQDAHAISEMRQTLDRLLADSRRSQASIEETQGRTLQQESVISNLTVRHEQSAKLSQIHDWTIRAEAGERAAFTALQKYVWESSTNSTDFYISFAQKNVNRISGLFTGEKILDPGVSQGEWSMSVIWPTNDIPVNLKGDNYTSRAAAVGTIGTMRLNSFIPTLVDMAFDEPDLYVLQLIVKTIDKAFEGCAPRAGFTIYDFLFPHYDGRKKFEEQWVAFSPTILKRKAKYIISEPMGPNGTKVTIVDPEAEQTPRTQR
jgi:hypothetical protein